MANNKAEIELVIKTKDAIKEAQDAGKEIQKALTYDVKNSGNKYLQQQQEILHDNLVEAGLLKQTFDDTGKIISEKLSRGLRPDGLIEYENKLKKVLELVDALEKNDQAQKALAEERSAVSANLPSLRGKIGSASRGKNADEIEKAKAAYAAEKAKLEELNAQDKALLNTQAELNKSFDTEYAKIKYIVTAMQSVSTFTDENKSRVEGMASTWDALHQEVEQVSTAQEQTATSVAETTAQVKQETTALEDAANAAEHLSSVSTQAETEGTTTPKPKADEGGWTADDVGERLKKTGEAAETASASVGELQDKINTALNFAPANNNIAELVKHLQELQTAQKALEKADMPQQYMGAYNQIYDEIERTKQAINAYKQSMRGVAETHKTAEKTGVGFGQKAAGAFNMLKKAGAGVGSLIKSVKSGFKSLDKHTGKVKSSFDGMARNMRSNFKHMLTNITKYVFGFRSLFFLIRRLRRYLKEGIENIVKYESAVGQSKRLDSTNQAINQLRTSLLFLQNAWAAAFAPIINAVTPWLTRLIDMVARAGNAVAKFIGVLTGQKTVLNAVKTPAKDYAKSLNKTGSGAGKAAKKQKQLNDRIAEFDDLILLGRDKDPNNGAGTGGGGGNTDDDYDYGKMFKKVKAISKLADMIKKAWKTGDFTDVGKWFSNKIIKALDKINDPKNLAKAQATAEKFGKSVATFFNGLFAKPEIWDKMGQAIGNGLNTITRAISGFLTNNKVKWGEGFARFINNIFKTIKWDEIKKNIKLFIDQLVDNLVDFMNKLDWKEIQKAADAIGSGLNEVIRKTLQSPDFMKALGKTFGELINTINTFISGVISGDSDDMFGGPGYGQSVGNSIAQFFITAFKTIKWKDVIKNIATVLSGLFDAINDLFSNEKELEEIAETLGEAFANIDWNTIIIKAVNAALKVGKFGTKVFALISNAISDAIINADPKEVEDAVKKFIEGINTDDFIDSCKILAEAIVKSLIASGALVTVAKGVIGGVMAGITSSITDDKETQDKMGSLGQFLGNKLLFGIGGVFMDIMDWIKTNLIEPFFSGFMECLNAEDTNPENLGKAIIEGLQNGISNAFGTAIDWVKQWLVDPIVSGFVSLFDIGSPSKVTEDWGKYLVEGVANGITNNLSNVSTAWEGLRTAITTIWNNTVSEVNAKLEALKAKFISIWSGIQDGIKAPIRGILSIVEKMVNIVIDGINSMINKLDSMPDWDITNPFNGKKYKMGFNIPTLKHVTLPKLAQGAVIPPNREFMAVLGDQASGTNIEAPLDTIKQAVAEVIANNGNQEMIQLLQELITVVQNKNLVIGDKEIGKATARYNNQQRIIRGTSF